MSSNDTDDGKYSDEVVNGVGKMADFDFIRLNLVDLNGIHLSKLVSTRHAHRIASGEVDIYAGIIAFGPRFEVIKKAMTRSENSKLKPDFETLHRCEWASKTCTPGRLKCEYSSEYKICSVICDLMNQNDQAVQIYPRTLAKKLINDLERNYKLKLYSAFEPEFTAFQPGTATTSSLDPTDAVSSSTCKFTSPVPYSGSSDMYKTSLLALYEDLFTDIDKNMQLAGIQLLEFSNENGKGQLEIPLLPTWGLDAADKYFSFKQAVKEIGKQHDMEISFMTKPMMSGSSNGCHYNFSLWKDGRNAFFDSSNSNNLSQLCRFWIGGLIEHLPAMVALCSPTVNCYRRFAKYLAPTFVDWDFNNRLVSIRVKNFSEKSTYIENRIPSSASSPYHVLIATLAAGIDGLERKIEPPSPGIKMDNMKLPTCLQEALDALKSDEKLVNKIGKDFVDHFIQIKERGDLVTLTSKININHGENGDVDHSDDNDERNLAIERYEYFEFS